MPFLLTGIIVLPKWKMTLAWVSDLDPRAAGMNNFKKMNLQLEIWMTNDTIKGTNRSTYLSIKYIDKLDTIRME